MYLPSQLTHVPHLKTWADWTLRCFLSENKMGYLCTSIARGEQIYLTKITERDEKIPSTVFACLAVLATKKSVADISEVGI